jgi:hypothetical protein
MMLFLSFSQMWTWQTVPSSGVRGCSRGVSAPQGTDSPVATCRLAYSMGNVRGRGPGGKALLIRASSASVSQRSPAPAFSAT